MCLLRRRIACGPSICWPVETQGDSRGFKDNPSPRVLGLELDKLVQHDELGTLLGTCLPDFPQSRAMCLSGRGFDTTKRCSHLAVLGLELNESVQHDERDVVVGLGHQQLAVAVGRGSHGCWRAGKGHQRDCALVHHRRARGLRR